MLPLPTPFPASIIPRNLPLATDKILVYHQPLQPDRSSRVYLVRADTNLGAEAKAHPVRHSGARVPEDAGAVDAGLEAAREVGGGGEDGVGVVGGVGVYVGDGEVDGGGWVGGGGGDGFDGEGEVEEFGSKVGVCCRLKKSCLFLGERIGKSSFRGFVAAEVDAFFEEGGSDGGEDGCEGGFVD